MKIKNDYAVPIRFEHAKKVGATGREYVRISYNEAAPGETLRDFKFSDDDMFFFASVFDPHSGAFVSLDAGDTDHTGYDKLNSEDVIGTGLKLWWDVPQKISVFVLGK